MEEKKGRREKQDEKRKVKGLEKTGNSLGTLQMEPEAAWLGGRVTLILLPRTKKEARVLPKGEAELVYSRGRKMVSGEL